MSNITKESLQGMNHAAIEAFEVFRNRPGWEVSIGDRELLVPSGRFVRCIDGRVSHKSPELNGIAIPGGIHGVMRLLTSTTEEGVVEAIKIIKKTGYLPYIHGDNHHGLLGCGYLKINLPGFTVSPERIKELVLAANGGFEDLEGTHNESDLVINTLENYTVQPGTGHFALDRWVAPIFGFNSEGLLIETAETVEKLNGPRKAIVVG